MTAAVRRYRRTAWLKTIPTEWPGDETYFRLKADRMGFYRLRVTDAARYLRHILLTPSPHDVVKALSERYFEPRQDWKLFEIAVLMRIVRSISHIGTPQNPTRLFHDGKTRPFATFQYATNREVRVWYQSWPPSTKPSELEDAIQHYELSSKGNRPDIVVEVIESGVPIRAILLELKASSSGTYLGSGLSQLLGYLRDRPALFGAPASGWLVAPNSTNFVSKAPGIRSLWVTTSDDVAAAVVSSIQAIN